MSLSLRLAEIIAPALAPARAAGRAALMDAAVFSVVLLFVLAGCGLWFAAGFSVLLRMFGVEVALLIGGLVLWTLALLVVLVRLLIRPTPPVPLVQPAPTADPLVQLVFDLSVMAGRALPRGRR